MEFLIVAIFVGTVVYVIVTNGNKTEKKTITNERKKLYQLEDRDNLDKLTYKYRQEFINSVTSIITDIVNKSKYEFSNFNINSFNVSATSNKYFKITFGYNDRVVTYDFLYSVIKNEKSENPYNNKKGIIIVFPSFAGIDEDEFKKRYDTDNWTKILRDIEECLEKDSTLIKISYPYN
ncbi:hypothetical protein [Flavivirga rizhaonensis]|uniref:Uncharacterized protein n=1 Tax=Flavivirga rizhaonensis TaxID=2559571 RepID=A0A4S1DXT3_9FLAO|nr:hypothetical protein [Flavivirga rizhaonensis]TGV02755.1 hypothetical protein EM932_10010 [Flavivirga rizhaonensis]